MNFNQGELVDGLIEDMLYTINKYDETLYMATIIGALELVKLQLIYEGTDKKWNVQFAAHAKTKF